MSVSVTSSVNMGFMVALVIGGLASPSHAGPKGLYWIILIFAAPQLLFLALSFCFLAESPQWLARKGERNRKAVEKEIRYLRSVQNQGKNMSVLVFYFSYLYRVVSS